MVAVALLGIVLATAGPNFQRSSISTKGAALALAAALTEARQQAITQQLPVALVIPSNNGSQGQANSYYIASGEQPRVIQVKRLGGEQSDLRLMVGHWPLDTSKLKFPALTTTITPPPEATWENDFNLNLWDLPAPKDYAFIFTPRGKMVSNDLPHFDGAYHIVVSHGGISTVASAPGAGAMTTQPTLYRLSQLGSPYTVAIDPSGSVSVTPGLVAVTASGVEIKDQAALLVPANPPALSPSPSSPPVVTSVALLPDPAKLDLPDGVDTLLAPGRHMTMTVRAKSPEGVPLFCSWKASDGGLSSAEEMRTVYLPASREWESVWQWRFPAGAIEGDRCTLEGVVKDNYGNETLVGLGASDEPFVVEAGKPVKIAFRSSFTLGGYAIEGMSVDGTAKINFSKGGLPCHGAVFSPDGDRMAFADFNDIYVINSDGTGRTKVTYDGMYNAGPAWSPNGSRLAIVKMRNLAGFLDSEIFVMNADGTGLTNLSNSPRGENRPAWSPNGQRIAYESVQSGNKDIYVMNADGTGQTRLTNHPREDSGPVWSPDGNRIAFWVMNGDIYVINADGTGLINLTNYPGTDYRPAWSPDGNRIAFSSARSGNWEIYVINADGTGLSNLTNNPASDQEARWLADGNRIAFVSDRDLNKEIYIMNADGSDPFNISQNPAALDDDFQIR